MVFNKVVSRLKEAIISYKTITPYLGNVLNYFFGMLIILLLALLIGLAIKYSPEGIYNYRLLLYIIFGVLTFFVGFYYFFAGLVKTKVLSEIVEANKKGEFKNGEEEKLGEAYKQTKFLSLIKKYPSYLLGPILVLIIVGIMYGLDLLLGTLINVAVVTKILNYLFTIIYIALFPTFLDLMVLPMHSTDYKVKTSQIKEVFKGLFKQFTRNGLNKYLEKLTFCFVLIIILYIFIIIASFLPVVYLLLGLLFLSYVTTCLIKPF
ncbi:MAG: hypothetical protein PHH82_03900 [Candidatus ainarchaeum sp.]|nr:hypothetical protein [Candidatus ainarchaeum sp.]